MSNLFIFLIAIELKIGSSLQIIFQGVWCSLTEFLFTYHIIGLIALIDFNSSQDYSESGAVTWPILIPPILSIMVRVIAELIYFGNCALSHRSYNNGGEIPRHSPGRRFVDFVRPKPTTTSCMTQLHLSLVQVRYVVVCWLFHLSQVDGLQWNVWPWWYGGGWIEQPRKKSTKENRVTEPTAFPKTINITSDNSPVTHSPTTPHLLR